jgi:hypothetical protein
VADPLGRAVLRIQGGGPLGQLTDAHAHLASLLSFQCTGRSAVPHLLDPSNAEEGAS